MSLPTKMVGVELCGFADELSAFAEGEGKSDADTCPCHRELSDGIGIDRVAMNGVAAVAGPDGITQHRAWKSL